ncbi:MAG: LLM class F420-dependent oxidoreductase [Acidimicrobiia bacterium]|nr:LLM class F420-dependent oxidoreductase [Acidimicrobiia bacterium]
MTSEAAARPPLGVSVPLGGPLGTQRDRIGDLVSWGYTDLWSAEASGVDGFTPLALAAAWEPDLRLGTAIIPVYTRGPATLAQSAAALAQAAPGRFALGIGTSSDVIVERWNSVPFVEPYRRARDTLRFLRAALSGEKVTAAYDTFEVRGFRLTVGEPPDPPVPLLLAALRPQMLRLAAREADGAIINWLSAADTVRVTGIVRDVAPDAEIVARLFVCPNPDRDSVRPSAKRMLAGYVSGAVYRAFQVWLGREAMLTPFWERWDGGDRAGALKQIPDELVDDIIVNGTPAACRAQIARYVANGVTTPVLHVLPFGDLDAHEGYRLLSPAAGD